MQIQVKGRGQEHQIEDVDLQSMTIGELRRRIYEFTDVPPENQKLLPKAAKGINLGASQDEAALSRTLAQAGFNDVGAISITVLGATSQEVERVQSVEKEATKWKQPRNYHPSMLRGTAARSTATSKPLNPFHQLTPHASLPTSSPLHAQVMSYLRRLAEDEGVVHVCRLHSYQVGTMTELLPWESPELLGLNENKGQTIRLRIRTDDAEGFRDYKTTRQVLLHELAHIDVAGHPVEFKELNSKLNAELAAFEKSAAEGTHSLHEGDMYVPDPSQATSQGSTGGGSYVLGGGNSKGGGLGSSAASSDERRQAILDATLRRVAKLEAEIEASCGSSASGQANS